MPIPNTATLEPSHSSNLLAGTIPISPGPMQRAFELDSVDTSLSPPLSPAPCDLLPTPMPGTNLTFEDIPTNHTVCYSDNRHAQESSDYFPLVNNGDTTEHVETTQGSYVVDRRHSDQEIHGRRPLRLDDQDKTSGTTTHRSADSCAPNENDSPAHSVEHLEHRMNITHIVWEKSASPSLTSVDLGPRQNIWGNHNGLYDGTGYGETRENMINTSMHINESGPTSVEFAHNHLNQNVEVDVEPVRIEEVVLEAAHPRAEDESLEEVMQAYTTLQRKSQAIFHDIELVDSDLVADAGEKVRSSCV
ncbi:hypothetical protein P153DRAFT_363382 [Dothidotthia symphoricarpi CBS 119687]|uniref:Uncharacterized protein n=1 Tax=Dothidotthia symphoricarpi CBS 119687 TaxID=1392245 RepID=A0A6A6APN6_9PLEO|nr:uncharacterized protein P153DRAFT_363382 [Dothidotthia symphoricarpi CBS 119687]KAF2133163.1 hypothetical protein P153DRAFT_363382 [Dothidotthia symphoricarpi CBS 119687]